MMMSFDYFSSFRVKPERRKMLKDELLKAKVDRILI